MDALPRPPIFASTIARLGFVPWMRIRGGTFQVVVPEWKDAPETELRVRRGGFVDVHVKGPEGGAVPRTAAYSVLTDQKKSEIARWHKGRREMQFRNYGALEPGQHTLLVEAPGMKTFEAQVQIEAGGERKVEVVLEAE